LVRARGANGRRRSISCESGPSQIEPIDPIKEKGIWSAEASRRNGDVCAVGFRQKVVSCSPDGSKNVADNLGGSRRDRTSGHVQLFDFTK